MASSSSSAVGINIKDSVKSYFALDPEIKESGKLLGQMRKKRKQNEEDIQQWMQLNNKRRITTKYGTLERVKQTRKPTVTKEHILDVLGACTNSPADAEEYVRKIYDDRDPIEVEVLKPIKASQSESVTASETADL